MKDNEDDKLEEYNFYLITILSVITVGGLIIFCD
jgi:hypothetical protein